MLSSLGAVGAFGSPFCGANFDSSLEFVLLPYLAPDIEVLKKDISALSTLPKNSLLSGSSPTIALM